MFQWIKSLWKAHKQSKWRPVFCLWHSFLSPNNVFKIPSANSNVGVFLVGVENKVNGQKRLVTTVNNPIAISPLTMFHDLVTGDESTITYGGSSWPDVAAHAIMDDDGLDSILIHRSEITLPTEVYKHAGMDWVVLIARAAGLWHKDCHAIEQHDEFTETTTIIFK